MRHESKAVRQVSLETIVEDFKELPAARKHLYFYIFLFLIAVLGQTLKNANSAVQNGSGAAIEQQD